MKNKQCTLRALADSNGKIVLRLTTKASPYGKGDYLLSFPGVVHHPRLIYSTVLKNVYKYVPSYMRNKKGDTIVIVLNSFPPLSIQEIVLMPWKKNAKALSQVFSTVECLTELKTADETKILSVVMPKMVL
ncbi:MAG: hypothetical protein Q4P66_08765 [Actinomycetaceae bacterium]|nr:hypothetical protein [Actinomycetaceae bacterium]